MWGLGGLPAGFTGTVVVTAADVPLLDTATLNAVIGTHMAGRGAAVTLTSFIADDPAGYGRIVRSGKSVKAIVEHKDASKKQLGITEVNAGVYAFDAALLRHALTKVSSDNAQGEFYLTDVIAIARKTGGTVRAHIVDDPYLVAGCKRSCPAVRSRRRTEPPHHPRTPARRVTVVDPSSTWIDVDVAIAPDVTIEPGTQLRGRTTIAEDAVVGPDTTLTDVTVGSGAGDPHPRQRGGDRRRRHRRAVRIPASRYATGESGKIGAFVETKNARIGNHTKVPHLSYVGDAEIGDYTNIGAASVFVNYDGVNKHKTVIGSHCRTGSDNMFVALFRSVTASAPVPERSCGKTFRRGACGVGRVTAHHRGLGAAQTPGNCRSEGRPRRPAPHRRRRRVRQFHKHRRLTRHDSPPHPDSPE